MGIAIFQIESDNAGLKCALEEFHAGAFGIGTACPIQLQRATLTSMYSLRTQHGIAACIDELGCEDPLAENACFKKANVGRVYLP